MKIIEVKGCTVGFKGHTVEGKGHTVSQDCGKGTGPVTRGKRSPKPANMKKFCVCIIIL